MFRRCVSDIFVVGTVVGVVLVLVVVVVVVVVGASVSFSVGSCALPPQVRLLSRLPFYLIVADVLTPASPPRPSLPPSG